jgi:hypothetical protein
MTPVLPFWFKQRQARAEPVAPDSYRLSGPNLREGYISIRQTRDGRWRAALSLTPDGSDLDSTSPEFDNTYDAWEAAFELYRRHFVV